MTEPEETPGAHLRPTAADGQRAAALIVHHTRHDPDGCNEIVMQAMTEDDPGPATVRLLFAVLELYQIAAPSLHNEAGLAMFTDAAARFAGRDPE